MSTDTQEHNAGESRFNYKWWVMVAVSIGTFMSTLDASIVNISLPTIMHSLHTKMVSVQWVVTIYLLVITGLLLSLGRLADMIGRKHVFLAGYAVFTAGSLMCGLSHSISYLVLFRAIQAVGAAMIMANGPAIITNVFPGNERGKALGINAMVVAAGLTAGPALGGLLIAISGWQMIFFINVPIGVIGMILVNRILASDKGGSIMGFDIPGAVLLIMSLVSLTMAFSDGVERGWGSSIIIALFCAFVMCGAAFVFRELHTSTPLFDLGLFGNLLFTFSSISALLSYVAMFCITYLMPFYMSQVLNYPPEIMGFVMITIPLTVALIAPFSGSLSDKIGSSGLGAVGMAVMSIGLMMVSRLGGSPDRVVVVLSLIVIGVGSGMFQSPNNSSIMGSVPAGYLGIAAGMLATMRNLGMVIGITLSGAIYMSRYHLYADTLSPMTADVQAFRDAFIVGSLIAAIGIVTSAIKGLRKAVEI
ncbi:MAG: MFS transporter [Armatimonadota bacterium]